MHRLTEAEFELITARLAHRFRDRSLLMHALTHASSASQRPDYQRLEFLGDRVLALVIAEELYRRNPTKPEGALSSRFSALVSGELCAAVAREAGIGEHVRLGRRETADGIHLSVGVLGDVMEALIAAIYLDGGLEAAETFLRRELKDALDEGSAQTFVRDYKSALQERLQALGRPLPEYRVSGEAGPDHRKTFSVEVTVNGEVLGTATGRAKKEAEQEAARLALSKLE